MSMSDHPSIGWAENIEPEPDPTCQATRYARGPCDGPPRFLVQYRTSAIGKVIDEYRACFRHGLAEVDRAYTSGGIDHCELVQAPDRTPS